MLADPRAIDALVDDFAAQWLNLRRVDEVVVDPDRLSELRREPAAGVPAGNGAVRRQHAPRGSQRRRSAERRLHVRQRTAGAALRHSRTSTAAASGASRCPNRDQRGGLLGARRAAGDDVVSRPHLAGAARQVAAEQHLRLAGAAAAARRRHQPAGDQAGRGAADRSASGWRSTGRIRRATAAIRSSIRSGFALENFDVIGGVADRRRVGQAGRRERRRRRAARRSRGFRPARAAARAARAVSRAPSPKSSWPTRSGAGSSTTIGRRCARSCATRRRRITAGRRSFWAS